MLRSEQKCLDSTALINANPNLDTDTSNMRDELVLQIGIDKVIQRHGYDKLFTLFTLTGVNGKTDPRQIKAQGVWCMIMVQSRSLACAV